MLQLDRHQSKVLLVMLNVLVLLAGVYVFKNLGIFHIGNTDSVIEYGQRDLLIDTQTEGEGAESNNTDGVEQSQSSEKTNEPPQKIKVYITGQVKNPGVIEVEEGSRLADVVELAGGALENADLMRVNLALKVKDEGMYYIPEIGEEIQEQDMQGIYGGAGNESSGSYSGADQKVNINTADEAMLDTLPGIGPSKARRIIEYRNQNGPFQSIEEIKNVSGIGDKTFEQLKDLITVK